MLWVSSHPQPASDLVPEFGWEIVLIALDRLAFGKSGELERGDVDGDGAAVDNQLGHAGADRGGFLEAGAREAPCQVQPPDSGRAVEHRPAVPRGVVDAAVATDEGGLRECRHAPRQARQRRRYRTVVEALDLAVDRIDVDAMARLDAEQGQLAAVRAEVGAEHAVDHHRVP